MSDQHPGRPPSQPKLRRGVCFQNCYFMPTMPNARTEENANRRIGETAAWSNRESATVINRSALSFTVSPFRRFAVSTSLTGLLLTLLSVPAVHAAASNPYGGIVDRNVFSLKPAPLVDPTPAAPPTPPVKLTLNGITTILGNKRALLHAQIPPRPPEPAKEENYMLTEGQRDGGVEVLSIDERAGIVKVNNNGLTETLNFVNNGAKAVAVAQSPVAAASGPAGLPAAGAHAGFGQQRQIPTRSIPGSNQYGGTPAQRQENMGFNSNNSGVNVPAQFRNNLSPEEQVLLIEGQRMQLQDQGKPEEAALFPVTEVTPGLGNENISPQ